MRVWTLLMAITLAGLVCAGIGLAACGDDGNDCEPACDGKVCGDDGCGGTCSPGCDTGETCNAQGQCEAGCEPDCAGKVCGDDGCDGTCAPGCQAGETCNAQGQCESGCQPDCDGKVCGDDGCDGTCAPGCQAGETCNAQGQCEAAGFAPRSGLWHYDEWNPAVNACNSNDVVSNGDGSFQLQDNGDQTFTVTPGDGTDPFDCTLVGTDFTCPQRAWIEVDLNDQGYDAVLQALVEVDGSFSDAEHIVSATQDGHVTCTGMLCAAAEAFLQTTFPCDITIDFTAHWQM